MPDLPILRKLPTDYEVARGGRDIVACLEDVLPAFRAAGYGPEGRGPVEKSDLSGRRQMREMVIEGERFVVRRFSHGGLLRWLTGTRFLDPERPFREILLARELERAGVPTPQVVAARARKRKGAGWRLEVVTRRVSGAIDFTRAIERMGEQRTPPGVRTRILAAAGALVRSMHDAGFFHADLTPKNLLVAADALQGAPPRTWVLDLDRSDVKPELTGDDRRRNLRRLFRHVSRGRSEGRLHVTRTDLRRFLLGYVPEGDGWRDLWHRIEREHARSWGAHAPGWLLERRFGAGSPRGS